MSTAGLVSFTNDPESPLPQTNCSLTTDIEGRSEFRLSLLLLLTGLLLILIDISITALLCIVKWKKCGVLAIAWYLVTVVCSATWTFLSVFYMIVVVPVWMGAKDSCDYLVMLTALISVAYCGVLFVTYVVVIMVVIAYDCNMWRNRRDNYM